MASITRPPMSRRVRETALQRSNARPVDQFVSIVMPCLNEEEGIGPSIENARRWLAATGTNGEVIIVDNGSTDRSMEIAEAAGASIVYESARGYGHALLRGIAEARGDIIVMGDCDGTYDFANLSPLIEPLRNGYDIAIGNRYAGGIAKGAMTWSHRYIGTPVISRLLQMFAGVKHGDSQCGLRAFTRDAVDILDLHAGGMEFASEMLLKASRRDLRIAEVPITYDVRVGEAKLRTMTDGWRHLRFLLLATPTWLYTVPGILLTVLGLATIGMSVLSAGEVGGGVFSWQPIFAGPILLVVGVNALAIGHVSRLYTDSIGLTNDSRMSGIYHKYLNFEQLAVAGILLVIAGLGIDGVLFWIGEVQGTLLAERQSLAALAQSMIIIGANLFLVGALGGLLRSE